MITTYEENVASFDKIDSAKAQELVKGKVKPLSILARLYVLIVKNSLKTKKLLKKRILISIMSIV